MRFTARLVGLVLFFSVSLSMTAVLWPDIFQTLVASGLRNFPSWQHSSLAQYLANLADPALRPMILVLAMVLVAAAIILVLNRSMPTRAATKESTPRRQTKKWRSLSFLSMLAITVSLITMAAWREQAFEISESLPTSLSKVRMWLTSLINQVSDPDTRAVALLGSVALVSVVLLLIALRHRTSTAATAGSHATGFGLRSTLGTSSGPPAAPGSELRSAVRTCKTAFTAVFIFSAISNALMLTGAIFMLEVYDRVLPSRSVPTLVALAVIATVLFVAQGLLDAIRSRVLVRVGAIIDTSVNARVFDAILRTPQRPEQRSDGLQPMRDLDAIRGFFGGPGPGALLDLPWLPFYVVIIWLFHPLLGITAILGAIALVGLTLLTELKTRSEIKEATQQGQHRAAIAEAGRRNTEAIFAMGLTGRLTNRFAMASDALTRSQNRVSDISGGLGSMARALRMMLQSAMLGIGAWLVIQGEATAGIIIAGSILVGRALAPVDQAIAQWRNFVAARQGWERLSAILARLPNIPKRLALPAPKQRLKVESITVLEPGGPRILVRDISFEVPARSGLAIIGPSGSGKSTFARALVGAWPTAAGRVQLDGAALDQWPPELLGRHIGYLPQDVELFAGTVAENIARLDAAADADDVVAAARAAGCHDMILNFRDGYQTQIGEGGAVLSAGQRQRIALARALYGEPFLVVLDEPNSNLDAEGDRALMAAIEGVRSRGGIVIVVSHRPSALEALDFVLIMREGRPVAFGPRDNVMAKYHPSIAQRQPPRVIRPVGAGRLVGSAKSESAGSGAGLGEVEESNEASVKAAGEAG